MIKIYGMPSCPDCVAVDEPAKNDPRDTHPAFDAVKKHGGIGIPCFVKEDGSITFDPQEVGLLLPEHDAPACNLDGTGC